MAKLSIYSKKRHLLFLAFLIFLAIVFATSLWKNLYVFSMATIQGSSVKFLSHEIHLGLKYVYVFKDNESIEIQKVMPGFKGLDEVNFLTFFVTKAGDIENLKEHCSVRPQSCEVRNKGRYVARAIPMNLNMDPEIWSYNSFYSERCNVYISYIGEAFGNIHREFVDRFFADNCT